MTQFGEIPHDLTMECYCLGAALHSEKWLGVLFIEIPASDYFYEPLHRDIFNAMLDLQTERKPVDIATVASKLSNNKGLQNKGGILYLNELRDRVTFPARMEAYAKEVYNKAVLRKVLEATDIIKNLCIEHDAKSAEVLPVSTKLLFDIGRIDKSGSLEELSIIMAKTLRHLEKTASEGEDSRRVKTGYRYLDEALGGMGNGSLNILAARPGVGKTSFAMNVAQNAALIYGKRVAFFSLEMSKEEISKRFFSQKARMNSQLFSRPKQIEKNQFKRMYSAMQEFEGRGIYIDDSPGISAIEMLSRARQLKSEAGLDLVVVDYLQLMSSKGYRENRQQEIAEISRTMKLMAKELDLAVLALSQLSREAEKSKENSAPKLSHLRESGAIEQDADSVWMLYRLKEDDDKGQSNEQESEVVELMLAKNRSGPLNTIKLMWHPMYTCFTDPAGIKDIDNMPAIAGGDAIFEAENMSYGQEQYESYPMPELSGSTDVSYMEKEISIDDGLAEDLPDVF